MRVVWRDRPHFRLHLGDPQLQSMIQCSSERTNYVEVNCSLLKEIVRIAHRKQARPYLLERCAHAEHYQWEL